MTLYHAKLAHLHVRWNRYNPTLMADRASVVSVAMLAVSMYSCTPSARCTEVACADTWPISGLADAMNGSETARRSYAATLAGNAAPEAQGLHIDRLTPFRVRCCLHRQIRAASFPALARLTKRPSSGGHS